MPTVTLEGGTARKEIPNMGKKTKLVVWSVTFYHIQLVYYIKQKNKEERREKLLYSRQRTTKPSTLRY
jgi:hypothetical protein